MFARKYKPVEIVIEADEVGHRDFEKVDRNMSNITDYEAATSPLCC